MKDKHFEEVLASIEVNAWFSFKQMVRNFLENSPSPEYEKVIQDLISSYQQLGSRISVKMHFLHSHLDYFLKNCEDYSEEEAEWFYQDICTMEI